MPYDPDKDPLEALRERIEATQAAVDRLAEETANARAAEAEAEAARAAGGASEGGAETAADGVPRASASATEELQALVALVDLARGLLPPELQAQLVELIRHLLMMIRSILDWWIDRMGPPPVRAPVEVEEIPIT